MEISQQVKTNAIIWYFFLWWIFLFARSNPNFEHSFIRKHAKKATKIHFISLITYIIYSIFISKHLYYIIPIILISINQIINLIFFAILTLFILNWAYRAYKWEEPSNILINETKIIKQEVQDSWNMDETQKIIHLSTYLPFIWLISANRNQSKINKYWVKVWWILTFFILFYYVFNWFDSIVTLLIFIYILIFVFSWVNLVINKKVIINNFIDKLPDLTLLYLYIKTWIYYFFDFLKILFWKKEDLDFKNKLNLIIEKENKMNETIKQYFTDDKIFPSKYLIYVPIINLIFIFKPILNKKSKYFLAIIEWIIISIILVLIWYFYWFYSNLQLCLLFPIFLWLANVDSNPFYKIPIIYEIYFIIDKVTFGLFSKIKFLKEKSKEVNNISFKV